MAALLTTTEGLPDKDERLETLSRQAEGRGLCGRRRIARGRLPHEPRPESSRAESKDMDSKVICLLLDQRWCQFVDGSYCQFLCPRWPGLVASLARRVGGLHPYHVRRHLLRSHRCRLPHRLSSGDASKLWYREFVNRTFLAALIHLVFVVRSGAAYGQSSIVWRQQHSGPRTSHISVESASSSSFAVSLRSSMICPTTCQRLRERRPKTSSASSSSGSP